MNLDQYFQKDSLSFSLLNLSMKLEISKKLGNFALNCLKKARVKIFGNWPLKSREKWETMQKLIP